MKMIEGGRRRDVTLYDCVVVGNDVPNKDRACIVSYENDMIRVGVCRALYDQVQEGDDGQYKQVTVAYCQPKS